MRGKTNERLSGVYALNAMDPAERGEFEACYRNSEALWAEVTELQDTAVLLGEALPAVEPPDYLRTRILAQIENTPQFTLDEVDAAHESFSPLSRLRAKLPKLRIAAPLLGVAALALLIAVPLSTTQPSAVPTAAPQATGVNAIIAAPDYQSINVQAGVGNAATVVWSRSLEKAAVKVSQNSLPPGKAYELWVVSAKGAAQPAGMVSSDSAKWVELSAPIVKGASVRMTIEPKWGSKQPTSPTLFEVST